MKDITTRDEQEKQNAGFLGEFPEDILCHIANELNKPNIHYLISTCLFFSKHNNIKTIKDNKLFPVLAAGDSHGLYLTSSSCLFAFGDNKKSPLGVTGNPLGDYVMPWIKNLKKGEVVVQIAAGDAFSMLLTNYGRLYGAGDNTHGQLGIPKDIYKTCISFIECPIELLKPDETIQKIILGATHSLLLTNQNQLLASGREGFNVYAFKDFKKDETIKQVAAGRNFNLVLTTEGRLYVNGCSYSGQLGSLNEFIEGFEECVITCLESDEHITYIAAGNDFSLLLTNKNHLLVSGKNDFSNLGHPFWICLYQFIPSLIPILKKDEVIIDIAPGLRHTLLLTNYGTLLGSGDNRYGQLGLPQNKERIDYFEVLPPIEALKEDESIVKVKAGSAFSQLITNKGRFFASGNNYFGQLGLPSKDNHYGFELWAKNPNTLKSEKKEPSEKRYCFLF